MPRKSKINEIIDIPKIEQQLQVTKDGLSNILDVMESVIGTAKKINLDFGNSKSISDINKTTKEFNDTIDKTNDLLKKQTKLEKERDSAEKSLERQRQRGLLLMAKEEAKERDLQKALNMVVKSEDDLIKKTAALVKVRRRLDTTTKQGRKQHRLLTKEINKNTIALKKNDSAIGRRFRNVGNYSKGLLSQLTGALGLTGGIYLVISAFQNWFTTNKRMEKSLSSLSAITGLVGDDLEYFKSKAVEYSKETLKSAVNIVKAFELVGSIRPELLKNKEALAEVTKQAIILSEATGGKLELEDAARATAGTLNQFSKDAGEASDVINVLAAGSKYGAATVINQTDALEKFGAVADAANVTLEKSTGLTQTLAEKQIIGAEAGTKLRNILIILQADQENYKNGVFDVDLALENLAKSNKDVTQLTKQFGRENVLAAQILVKGRDKVIAYSEAVTDTNVALEQQSIQNDNVAGTIARISNNWEVFMLKLNSSNGWLADNLKFINTILKAINSGIDDVEKSGGKLFDSSGIVNETVVAKMSIEDINKELDTLNKDAKIYFENWKKTSGEQRAFWATQYDIAKQNIDIVEKSIAAKKNEKKTNDDNNDSVKEAVLTLKMLTEESRENMKLQKLRVDAMVDGQKKELESIKVNYKEQIQALELKIKDTTNLTGGEKKHQLELNKIYSDQILQLQENQLKEEIDVSKKYNLIALKNLEDNTQLKLETVVKGSEQEKDLRIGLIESQREIEIAEAEKTGASLADINAKYDKLIIDERLKFALQGVDKETQIRLTGLSELQAKETAKLREKLSNNEISVKEYNNSITDIEEKAAIEQMKIAVKLAKDKLALIDSTTPEYLAAKQALIDAEIELDKKLADVEKGHQEQSIEDLKIKKEKTIEILQASIDAVSQAGDLIHSMNTDRISQEMDEMETQKQWELDQAEGNEEKQAEIKRKFHEKEIRLKMEQDKADKEAAIFRAFINIASAVLTMLANTGGPAGFITAAFAATMGAYQLANIVSTPLPKYAKGRKDGPAEFAVVGEEGTEGIKTKDGKTYLTPDKPTLTWLPGHAEVIPHHELVKMAENTITVNTANVPEPSSNQSINELKSEVRKLNYGFDKVAKAVKEKEHFSFNVTGNKIWHRSGNHYQQYMTSKVNE